MRRKEDPNYMDRVEENLKSLNVGDEVSIHDCFEADLFEGQTFTVTTPPYDVCGTWCVYLKGIGCFDIGRLKKENKNERASKASVAKA